MSFFQSIGGDQPADTRKERRQRRRLVTQSQWAREQQLHHQIVDSPVSLEERFRLLQNFGDFSLAYSTAVQPLLKYHGDSAGYLAWRQRWGVACVLGDPVTAEDQQRSLLESFVDQQRHPVFCQVSSTTARHLADLGFWVNECGVDTRLGLDEYTLAGKEKEWLRYAANWVQRRGYQVVEADFDTVDAMEVESVSEAWRKTRTVKKKEVRFLNRPIVLEQETDVRRFFLFNPEGRMDAFVFFDPLYRDGRIVGYVTAFKRRHPECTQYGEQAIMKVAIEQFKAEGVPELRLGLSPFAWIEDGQFTSSRFVSKVFRSLYHSKIINRRAYHLVGHAEYKRRFRGNEEKLYFASRSRFSFRALGALVGLCGIA